MSALLLFSMRCQHSVFIIELIKKHKALQTIVKLHDINKGGIPQELKGKINSVPVIITNDGNIMAGKEAKNWILSMIPDNNQVMSHGFGGMGAGIQSLENPEENDSEMFDLDSYGSSLAPTMTPELQRKIDMNVSDAYNTAKQQ